MRLASLFSTSLIITLPFSAPPSVLSLRFPFASYSTSRRLSTFPIFDSPNLIHFPCNFSAISTYMLAICPHILCPSLSCLSLCLCLCFSLSVSLCLSLSSSLSLCQLQQVSDFCSPSLSLPLPVSLSGFPVQQLLDCRSPFLCPSLPASLSMYLTSICSISLIITLLPDSAPPSVLLCFPFTSYSTSRRLSSFFISDSPNPIHFPLNCSTIITYMIAIYPRSAPENNGNCRL